MKKLLITLLLISPFSFADWGDVYYCQETSHSTIGRSGDQSQLSLGKFTFKLDKAKNAMVFGKDGYFGRQEHQLIEVCAAYKKEFCGVQFPPEENWFAKNEFAIKMGVGYEVSAFDKGYFVSSFVAPEGIESITADCEKF